MHKYLLALLVTVCGCGQQQPASGTSIITSNKRPTIPCLSLPSDKKIGWRFIRSHNTFENIFL